MDPYTQFLITLSGVPYVIAHPWILTLVLPSGMWFFSHIMANVPQPNDQSNAVWKTLYPVLNLLSANYAYTKNQIPNVVPSANSTILTETTVTSTPSAPIVDTSNTVTIVVPTKGVK